MNFLVSGIVLFFAVHLIPGWGGLRRKLIDRIGDVRYKALYSIIAFIGLILIIYGKSTADFQSIWIPPAWASKITVVLMVLSCIFLVASGMKTNLTRFTRHPMLWGVTFWSIGHLSANGDLAAIVLFGSFGIFSLAAMFSANLRGAKKGQTEYPIIVDVIVLIVSLTLYVVFVVLHPYLIGVAVI